VTEAPHDGTNLGEDAFHEIQLSGKQLVFLFMATTVVSVVIFLCGVLVGRGVRAETMSASNGTVAPSAAGPGAPSPSPAPAPAVDPPATPAESALSYPKRLDGDKAPAEELKKSASDAKSGSDAEKIPAPAAPQAAPAAASVGTPPAAAPATASGTARPGTWAVQVVALTDRAAATAVMQRLTAKGYPAFLVNPQPGAPVQNYKVQVGRFGDRGEAEQVKGRLKKEEQFEPWILR
jgi:cell division septation protein DedD